MGEGKDLSGSGEGVVGGVMVIRCMGAVTVERDNASSVDLTFDCLVIRTP